MTNFEIEVFNILVSLGVPGVALGILYFLFRKFSFSFPPVQKRWVGPIVILFMLLISSIVFYTLSLWSPKVIKIENEDKNTTSASSSSQEISGIINDQESILKLELELQKLKWVLGALKAGVDLRQVNWKQASIAQSRLISHRDKAIKEDRKRDAEIAQAQINQISESMNNYSVTQEELLKIKDLEFEIQFKEKLLQSLKQDK